MFSNITISNYSKRNEVQLVKEIELTELLGDIYRKIMKRFSRYAEAAGISLTEGMVLWRIHKHGCRRVSEIAAQIGLPPSTLTGVLDRLVAGDWLEREADPEDRRAVLMKSTAKLVEFTKSSMRASSRSLEKSFRTLPPELMDRLVADLASVLECLERDEENQR
ncbi:MAG: MarR family winged helix-turn-helix transcriptional regulator [Rectinemataceae bacterium]